MKKYHTAKPNKDYGDLLVYDEFGEDSEGYLSCLMYYRNANGVEMSKWTRVKTSILGKDWVQDIKVVDL